MSTFIAVVVWGAFVVGYVAMLALTERTAGRYVRGEIPQPRSRTTIVYVAPTGAPRLTTVADAPRVHTPAAAA